MPFDLEDLDGVGPTTAKKLRDRGVFSPLDLASAESGQLVEDGVAESRDAAGKLIEAAQALLSGEGAEDFVTALDDLKYRKTSVKKLTTGSKTLDGLLGGGIETRAVTEFYGEFGSGKSQLCHTIAVEAQHGEQVSGLEGSVLYIDTEGTFRPERVEEILRTKYPKLTQEEVDGYLSKIHVGKAFNSERLWWLVRTAGKLIVEKGIRLMIVDSLTNLHRAEYVGRGELAPRQQKLNKIVHKLTRIAEYFGIAVVFTNQVIAKPDTFFGDPTAAAGGNVIAHGSTYRIYLRKSGANKLATFVDSPYNAYNQVKFTVTAAGVTDIIEKKTKDDTQSQ